jgi:hypothetical protein
MEKKYLDPEFIVVLKRTMRFMNIVGGKNILLIVRLKARAKCKQKKSN